MKFLHRLSAPDHFWASTISAMVASLILVNKPLYTMSDAVMSASFGSMFIFGIVLFLLFIIFGRYGGLPRSALMVWLARFTLIALALISVTVSLYTIAMLLINGLAIILFVLSTPREKAREAAPVMFLFAAFMIPASLATTSGMKQQILPLDHMLTISAFYGALWGYGAMKIAQKGERLH